MDNSERRRWLWKSQSVFKQGTFASTIRHMSICQLALHFIPPVQVPILTSSHHLSHRKTDTSFAYLHKRDAQRCYILLASSEVHVGS